MALTTFSFFLGGLAAAGIPVLLHLLMRGKPKRIEFPALMFLRKRLETYRRNYRIKHLILLTLRMLALILFGLALARPTLKIADWFPNFVAAQNQNEKRSFVSSLATSLGSQDAPIAAAIVVDSSLRMEYVTENQTRLDVAKDFSRWILSQLPQGSSVAVLSSDRETAVFQVDRLAAEEKINRFQIAPLGRPVAEAAQDALILLSESPFEQRELYIVSDLTEPGWRSDFGNSLQNLVTGMKSKSGVFGTNKELGLFVVDVSAEQPVNSSINRFTLVPEIITAQAPVRIDAEVSHFGSATSKTLELLLVGLNPEKPDEETVRSSKTVDFTDGESRQYVSFTLTGFEPGTHQGKLRFTVADALTADDQTWFTVQVQPPWKILLASPPPVRDSSLYLRQALETVPFEVETIPISDVPGLTAKELAPYSGVILLDPPPLNAAVWKKLADYASTGHGVGVFLGEKADSLESFNAPAATEVLGAKLVRQARDPDGETWIDPGIDSVSPIFSVFKQLRTLENFPWNALPVFRYWELNDFSPRADIAAAFTDNRAAIVAQTIGRGHTVTVATPVSELADVAKPWNLLTHGEAPWMFLLLSEGIAKYLIGIGEQQFNFAAGDQIVLRPNQETLPPTCLLGTPSGKSIRLTPDQIRREIVIPSTSTSASEPGNYRLRSGGATESLDTGFSVNYSGDSTNLQKIDKARLDQLLGEGNYRLAKTPQEVELGIARRRIGQELYAAIMLILAVLFTAEYVFANRFFIVKT